MGRRGQVKKRIAAGVLVMFSGLQAISAQENGLSAQEILQRARISQGDQDRQLSGRLRSGATIIPFRLVLDGRTIRYNFYDPPHAVLLKLGDTESRLEERTPEGGNDRVTEAELGKKVRNTDITLEDLSLRFLYWRDARVEGEGTILTRKAWKLHLEPSSARDSQYGAVNLWVEKESGALLRAECYDKRNALTKRFEVKSVQRAPGGWILKQMRIEAVDAATQKVVSRTYLEIDPAAD